MMAESSLNHPKIFSPKVHDDMELFLAIMRLLYLSPACSCLQRKWVDRATSPCPGILSCPAPWSTVPQGQLMFRDSAPELRFHFPREAYVCVWKIPNPVWSLLGPVDRFARSNLEIYSVPLKLTIMQEMTFILSVQLMRKTEIENGQKGPGIA